MIAATKQMKYAIVYCRFSDRPGANNCQSCEAQLDALRQWCNRNGYTIRGEYRDDAKSGGTTVGREGLKLAIASCKRGDTFLVYDVSRLSRNLYHSLSIFDGLTNRRVNFATIEDGVIGWNDENKVLTFQVKSIMAEYQRKIIKKTTSQRMKSYQRAGRRMSGIVVYGQKPSQSDPKRTEPNPDEQDVIRVIVRLRGEGESLRGIAARLHGMGISNRGKDWNAVILNNIIKRESETT